MPEGTVQLLLDQKEWIYHSKRVGDLLKKQLIMDQLYSVFSSDHHVRSAALLFGFLKDEDCAVVYGHQAQGKTQFLFFVYKLLQAMGEKVLFLDRSILPVDRNTIQVYSDKFCGRFWKDSLQIEGDVKIALTKLYEDAIVESFQDFISELRKYASTQSNPSTPSTEGSKPRIWVIVDEVVFFQKYITFPDEHDLGPFKWIVTGSAGIGTCVADQHLKERVFDLPIFDRDECRIFAEQLCNALGVTLADSIDGIPPEGIADWLEERFGGVVGYIVEMCLEIAQRDPNSVSQYMLKLSDRIVEVITKL